MTAKNSAAKPNGSVPEDSLKCGVVMPISSTGDYTDSHWADVLTIINSAIADAGLEANMVSSADEVTVIQKTIVQNLYDNPIVVCDVSGKNPNVMFELGLRLAFDKPTIIVKDSATTFSFDTGPVEHLQYPRDLRFGKIVEFKAKLTEKIKATLEAAAKDPKYSTFLKHFGKFTVAKLDEKEVSSQEYVIEEIRSLRQEIAGLNRPLGRPPRPSGSSGTSKWAFSLKDLNELEREKFKSKAKGMPAVVDYSTGQSADGHIAILEVIEQHKDRVFNEALAALNDLRAFEGHPPLSMDAARLGRVSSQEP